MTYLINSAVSDVIDPPIPEAQSWVADPAQFPDKPFLNLSQAVPSYAPAEPLQAHLAELSLQGTSAFYTEVPGLPELRDELAQHMASAYQGQVQDQQVAITAGCNQAFCVAISALAKPGDEIILPTPWYFNHQMWLAMQQIGCVPLACLDGEGALPDPERARELITPATKAIVLVTPNNPTGAIYSPELIRAFYQLSQEHNIALVIDETYKDFRDDRSPAHDLFQDPDWSGTLVQLYSFSKAYSLTGYRVGSIIAGLPLIQAVTKILDTLAICAPNIGQRAALYGLRHLSDWCNDKRLMMIQRSTALRAAFDAPELNYLLISSGAYFAYVCHPFSGVSSRDVAKRLAGEFNLLALPGAYFGPGQEDYLRLAYANLEADKMADVVARLISSQT